MHSVQRSTCAPDVADALHHWAHAQPMLADTLVMQFRQPATTPGDGELVMHVAQPLSLEPRAVAQV
jgi:hypothetical protein